MQPGPMCASNESDSTPVRTTVEAKGDSQMEGPKYPNMEVLGHRYDAHHCLWSLVPS